MSKDNDKKKVEAQAKGDMFCNSASCQARNFRLRAQLQELEKEKQKETNES